MGGDMERDGNQWVAAEPGETVAECNVVRRRIGQQPTPDDPGGPGWRDVWPDEVLRHGDLFWNVDHWQATQHAGQPAVDERTYRRRIEQQQPSDSERETVDDLRQRLAEADALLAEAERGGLQVNAELQQLREQVQALTLERERLQKWLHDHQADAQQQVLDRLQSWLRPVLELVAEHPDDCGPLAVSVLGYLPGIASRLIEE